MLTFEEFIEKISYDFKKVFPEVKVGENLIHLGSGVTHIELPLGSMYSIIAKMKLIQKQP